MLLELHIKNFIIVDDLHLDFDQGMSVVTGETGAGKSILLDALSFVLGGRILGNVIREGAAQCEVTAVFQAKMDDSAEDTLILKRVLHQDGRSKASINHEPVLLQHLKQMGANLVDLVGQHEHQCLLKPEVQLQSVDEYAHTLPLACSVKARYQALCEAESQLEALIAEAAHVSGSRDFKRYQWEELEALALTDGEIDALHQEQKKLSSVHELLTETSMILTKLKEDEPSLLSLIREVGKPLTGMAEQYEELNNAATLWKEASVLMEEAGRDITHFHDSLELDPARLQTVEARLSEIYAAARKHQVAPADLLVLHDTLRNELEGAIDYSEAIESLRLKIASLHEAYQVEALDLSTQRKAAVRILEGEVSALMKKLGMSQGECQLVLTPLPAPSVSGLDQLQFLVRINVGQSFEPLKDVASGGELSRIALIMAVLTSQQRRGATLIFDEVDVGISGSVAEQVGDLIHQLATQGQQIICITHLPQVALKGDQHLYIRKRFTETATFTEAGWLTREERIQEIARLMSGEQISEAVLLHVEAALLQNA